MSADRIFLNRAARNIEESPQYRPISKVRLLAGNDQQGKQIVFEAGSDTGRTVEVENPWATQEIANNLLAAIQGYAYKPYSAPGSILDPAAELGDAISIGEVYSVLADITTTISPIMSADIAAPEGSNIDHEYPYEPASQRGIERAVSQLRTSLIVEQGHIAQIIEDIGGLGGYDDSDLVNRISTVEQTASEIKSSLETTYYTKDGADSAIELYVSETITEDSIVQLVSGKFDAKGAANQALLDAKGYADEQKRAITTEYTTAISQSLKDITATVSKAITRYDVSGLSGTVIQDYGIIDSTRYPAAQHVDEYYVNVETGEYWKSNGTTWVKQEGTLQTVQDSLESKLSITDKSISTEVSNREEADRLIKSLIEQTAGQIRLEVLGANAQEWSNNGSSQGFYFPDDVVKVPQVTVNGVVTGWDYYKQTYTVGGVGQPIPANDYYKPGTVSGSQYWTEVDPPSVQSAIDASLDGITLSYSNSSLPNSAVIALNRNGVQIDASVITMSNVVADTIAAGTYIQSPVILNAAQNIMMTLNSTYPGPGVELSILNSQNQYYQFFKLSRLSNDTWFTFDGATRLIATATGMQALGTWDFSGATVIMPSS